MTMDMMRNSQTSSIRMAMMMVTTPSPKKPSRDSIGFAVSSAYEQVTPQVGAADVRRLEVLHVMFYLTSQAPLLRVLRRDGR